MAKKSTNKKSAAWPEDTAPEGTPASPVSTVFTTTVSDEPMEPEPTSAVEPPSLLESIEESLPEVAEVTPEVTPVARPMSKTEMEIARGREAVAARASRPVASTPSPSPSVSVAVDRTHIPGFNVPGDAV
jgi:hypothetical protein